MSVIYGLWDRNNKVIKKEWQIEIASQNAWWQPKITSEVKEDNCFFGGAFLEVDELGKNDNISKSHNLQIICNARIDNRKELESKLRVSDQITTGQLILLSYKRYGRECPNHIIGAFSFAIFDIQNESIFCARDHVGVKPFHYSQFKNYFVFGTLKRTMLCLPFSDKSPNWDFKLEKLLNYNHTEEATEYKNVHRLPPGSYLYLERKKPLEIKRYWSLDSALEVEPKSDEEYFDGFRFLIKQAVSCRMHGTNRIGSHISGGLDSSGILGIASEVGREMDIGVEAFSYTVPKQFENEKLAFENENPLIFKQIEFSEIDHLHRIERKIFRTRRKVLELEAQWTDGYSALNKLSTEYEMQHKVHKEGLSVVLSGFLGDELPTSFARAHFLEHLDKGHLVKYFSSKYRGEYRLSFLLGSLFFKMTNKLGVLSTQQCAEIYQNYRFGRSSYNKKFIDDCLFDLTYFDSKFLAETIKNNNRTEYIHGYPFSLKAYQKNHVHRRISSMRMESENLAGLNFHVQYRYPFSDIRLLQFVLSLPVDQKIGPDVNRRIYRKSMRKYIHPDILLRDNKMGHIKPLVSFYKDNTIYSLFRLYHDLKQKDLVPYLNRTKLDDLMEKKSPPKFLAKYLMYGVLANEGKMTF